MMTRIPAIVLAGLFGAGICSAQDQPQGVNIIVNPNRGDDGEPELIVVPAVTFSSSGELVIPSMPIIESAVPVPAIPVPTVPPPHRPEPGGRRNKSRMVPALPKEFEAKDKNGDGQIGMYEWDRTKYAEFARLDKNGDGFLTPQELNAKGNLFGARGRGGVLEKDALPNPGSLTAYAQKVGESFTFSVTGRTSGSIYGTGTYTTDSDLATVAVHAGLVKDGEKGIVTVTIVASPNQFSGTAANGVTSSAWNSYPSAYTVR